MVSAEQIRSLVDSFADRNEEQFRTIALEIAAAAAKAGDTQLAKTVRSLVERSRRTQLPPALPKVVPITRPEGDLSSLLTVSYPKVRLVDMVIPSTAQARLQQVLVENRARDELRSHGLTPRRRLMLVGPPGCGKTMTAKAIAGELSLPLFVVQFHSLITKFMGETASKLFAVFQAMQTTRGVYLFDEFDVVGTSRTATDDVGEARRVVNSFLQLLEHDDSESIVIAATNRPEAIDVAMFRRFDDLLVFSPPDADAIRRLVEGRLAPFQSVNLQWAAIRKAAIGLSHAEIVKGCEDAAKRTVLAHQRAITTRNLIEAFNARKRPTPRRASTSQTPKRRRGK